MLKRYTDMIKNKKPYKKKPLLNSSVNIRKVKADTLGFNAMKIPLKKSELFSLRKSLNLNVVESLNSQRPYTAIEIRLDNKDFKGLKALLDENKIPYLLEGTGPRKGINAYACSKRNTKLGTEAVGIVLRNLDLK